MNRTNNRNISNGIRKKEKPDQQLIVDEDCYLLDFLLQKLKNKSRNNVKTILSSKSVSINNRVITQFDYPLKQGQTVKISQPSSEKVVFPKGLDIVYEDDDLIAINKPAGLLAISTDKEKSKTAYHLVREYVESKSLKNRIYIVHRLDRDTSGVMVFAKNEKIKLALQENWDDLVLERGYVAVVVGKVEKQNDRIQSWLMETKTHMMYSTNNKFDGKEAITNYTVLKQNDNFSLLEIFLETGRKNQIRVHMKDIGHPIIGDKMYGEKTDPLRRLGLHAYKLTFINPFTKETMCFETKLPKGFHSLTS